jgi:hypothetical protein
MINAYSSMILNFNCYSMYDLYNYNKRNRQNWTTEEKKILPPSSREGGEKEGKELMNI